MTNDQILDAALRDYNNRKRNSPARPDLRECVYGVLDSYGYEGQNRIATFYAVMQLANQRRSAQAAAKRASGASTSKKSATPKPRKQKPGHDGPSLFDLMDDNKSK